MLEGSGDVDKRRKELGKQRTSGAGRRAPPADHSPLAQKTPTLLESENGTSKTSLWLSKRLSGPSQLSTMGDMSCKSAEMGTLEATLPAPHPQVSTPTHPRHTPSSDASWLLVRSGPPDTALSRSQFTSRTAP